MDKSLHPVRVTGHDDDQVLSVVLHVFQQHLDGLMSEVVGAVRAGQGVGLIDKQHAAHRLLYRLLGLQGSLAHKTGHQSGPVHLHQLTGGQHPYRLVYLGQQPGYRGLASPRISHEYQVEGHGRDGQARLLPKPAHLHQIDEALHIGLHLVQAA